MTIIHEVANQIRWNKGESEMQKLLKVPYRDNPSTPFLTPNRADVLTRCPLMALGALDSQGRPWVTLIGGEAGFSRPIATSVIGIKTLVDRVYDPVMGSLLGHDSDGTPVKVKAPGNMVGGLAIDLENRKRVKIYGRLVGGLLHATSSDVAEAQIVVKVDESLGNCPKYVNEKKIVPQVPQPELVSEALPLSPREIDIISKTDVFFISSSNSTTDMDTNFRGGPPGFVRVQENTAGSCVLVYPEYSGNRLYQTLGNLRLTPRAGILFPDFETGDVLYLTGKTEILIGPAASALLPRTNLAVKISVTAARFVAKGLGFRGIPGEPSPYNPPIRYLASEKPSSVLTSTKEIELKLVQREILTPTIARFRFRVADDVPDRELQWKPGQYAMLSLEKELNIGYSHMRDDDPTSLNDDFMRTFTISNRPNTKTEFEITIRNVGVVTSTLFRHTLRCGLNVSLKGFGGSFSFHQSPNKKNAFVAGGIGITPLLAQAEDLHLANLTLFWSVSYADTGLVIDTFKRIPGLSKSSRVFVTGKSEGRVAGMERIKEGDAVVEERRITAVDLLPCRDQDGVSKWYICAGTKLRTNLLAWLAGEEVAYEDFNY